jgi:hypothetical protein
MSIKLVGSVSAFALALALSGAAMAQTADNNSASTVTQVSIPGLNGNSLNSNNSDSSTDSSTRTIKSGNSILSGNTVDSNNTRTDDSFNTDNSTHTKTVTVTKTFNISDQELEASVSRVSQGSDTWDNGRDAKRVRTGDISQSGNAFASFAGISTASNNSGFGSNGQAATMVNANANVTFGAP